MQVVKLLKTIPAPLVWPLGLVSLLLLVAFVAPILPLSNPVTMNISSRLVSPNWLHWLGTDEYGRDVLSRIIWGARVTLTVALASSAIACVIGVALALVGGYYGGLAELLTVRLTDIVLSFPPILLALLVVTIAGPGSGTLILVLSVLYVPGFARVAYGEVLSARAMEYVEASRALGARSQRIIFRIILPNILPPILVQFSLTVAAAIVIESGLSFLGLGVVPPAPSWGLMIRGARSVMDQHWLLLLWPSLALVLTITLINWLCDAMRDVFDPRAARFARLPLPQRLGEAVGLAVPNVTGAASPPPVLLSVQNLQTHFATSDGIVRAVDGVSFELRRGETLAVVGESGSGKSITGLSILGLVPQPAGQIVGGRILLDAASGAPRDLASLDEAALRDIRGKDVAMIFQEPMTSLNPVYRIGTQIAEAAQVHLAMSSGKARELTIAMLEKVGIPDAVSRVDNYPHQLSGGMRQRVMIAMALICNPGILIADEPTTALDVTIQAEILSLLAKLQRDSDNGMGVIFITHNLGVVAEIADRVAVMYAGRLVEEGDVRTIFKHPRHPYTIGLLQSVPKPGHGRSRRPLATIPGTVPGANAMPPGCAFAPRCSWCVDICTQAPVPALFDVAPGHHARCHRWREL